MKSQDHKAANEDKAKVKPGIKSSPQVTHPILHLQQILGNHAVTSMIHRQEVSHVKLDVDLEDMIVDSSVVGYERVDAGQGSSGRGTPGGSSLGNR